MKEKVFSLQNLLYLALVLALFASLNHVAYAFSTVNSGNQIEAYVSAIAIDLGMLALAAGINKRRRERRSTRGLWFGVILFSVISTYANWLAGLAHVNQLEVTLSSFSSWLVNLRPVLLSAVLPTLVIFLSEVVSEDHQREVIRAERQAKKEAKQESIELYEPGNQDTLTLARETKQANVNQRREQLVNLLDRDMSHSEIAGELGVSLSTVKRDLKAVQNGNGTVSA